MTTNLCHLKKGEEEDEEDRDHVDERDEEEEAEEEEDEDEDGRSMCEGSSTAARVALREVVNNSFQFQHLPA